MTARAERDAYERRDFLSTTPRGNLQAGLVARSRELSHIDQVLWQARRGKSGAVALRGESGVGKSALIEATVARATEFRTIQVRGQAPGDAPALPPQWPHPLSEVVSSLEDSTPALPQLAATSHAPPPVADPPSPVVVDAATVALRRMFAGAGGPLLVTVDDCQALPPGLVEAIAAAVLTHLGNEPISLVLAWRDTPHLAEAPWLLGGVPVPQHHLTGLTIPQAHQLVASRFDVPPADHVLAELVALSGGNPLVLVDVCGRLTPAEAAGWRPLPDPLPVTGASAEGFDVVQYLPPATRRALMVVAAGRAPRDAMLDAMDRLGVAPSDLAPAFEAGIIYERGPRIDFRHPLVRSVAFHREPLDVRRAVRAALSDVLAERQSIEASAYHASVDAVGHDDLAARRLIEAARVALDRGDPAMAARREEMAAQSVAAPDVAVRHLADAAGHWLAVGERERAQHCVDSGNDFAVNGSAAAELAYQQARLTADWHESAAAEKMEAAADACIDERPHRALAMLIDAVSWRVLSNRLPEAEAVAERALQVARVVSSHSEVLARTVRAAAVLARGGAIDEVAERSHVSLLIGQTERFPSSPEVALVIGRSLGQQGLRRQADRWAQWIERCADQSGDRALAVVPRLLTGSNLMADGHLEEAAQVLIAAAAAADRVGSAAMAAWGWHLATHVHALVGDYEKGFSDGARMFALADRIGGLATLRALPALSLLELQRGRAAAAAAWALTAEEDLLAHPGTAWAVPEAVVVDIAPVLASVLLLARRPVRSGLWADLLAGRTMGGDGSEGLAGTEVPAACRAWLSGVCGEDPEVAVADLASASAAYSNVPFRQALVELCRAVRLAEAGRPAEAAERLDELEHGMQAAGADGLVRLVARERAFLPPRCPVPGSARAPAVGAPASSPAPSPLTGPVGPEPDWEVSLLGNFGIRHKGKPVNLPPSLAAQAVKIVALHLRITVDEVIELLWEDAEPGVGQRRLRNVLWRIRSACGDLLVREGNFLCLADGAVTDVARFRSLAEDALMGPEAGTLRAVDIAREALGHYGGELLPGDRYADWTAAARESVARTHLGLLDLLVDDAVAAERHGEALVLLDRLAGIDPFDERHHLRTAEIHLEAGNRGKALDALERAERMLAELRVAPSPAVRRLRDSLDKA